MGKNLKITALEAYYGGSHKQFIDKIADKSVHNYSILTLPPNKWKWRMTHSAHYFAEQINNTENFYTDLFFCSDMLNLPEFVGLLKPEFRNIPIVLYFHENQLVYPTQYPGKRNYNFMLMNIKSALAADFICFNSDFNRQSLIDNAPSVLKKMPDYNEWNIREKILEKSEIVYPGINKIESSEEKCKSDKIHILWAARWEHDKNPEDFFRALDILKKRNFDFKLSVIGEQFRNYPEVFDEAEKKFSSEIVQWGYQPTRKDYENVLDDSDIIVSTAVHEFYGISVLEAVSAGALPVLPERLSYPELFKDENGHLYKDFFYDGSYQNLAEKLANFAEYFQKNKSLDNVCSDFDNNDFIEKFNWNKTVEKIDRIFHALLKYVFTGLL